MKIFINLVSGQKVERELVTAFSAGTLTYVVFDAAAIGNGGMPIVLVCKLAGEKLVKMTEQSEWQSAKENLKAIIAGNTMNYINMPNEINADDVFYTQLTIPIPSFDLIKNAYKPQIIEEPKEEKTVESVPTIESPVNLTNDISVEKEVIQPVSANVVQPVVNNNIPEIAPLIENSVAEVIPLAEKKVPEVAPIIDKAAIPEQKELPPIPSANEVAEIKINNVIPEVSPISEIMPVVDNTLKENTNTLNENQIQNNISTNINLGDSKELFMKACETMFDALVSKFQAELDKK